MEQYVGLSCFMPMFPLQDYSSWGRRGGRGGGGLACIPKLSESGQKIESTRHPNKVREA